MHHAQLTANNRRRKDLYTLPHADNVLLDSIGYKRKLQEIDIAILANADFLNKIVANPEIFGHDVTVGEDGGLKEEEDVTLEDSQRPLKHAPGIVSSGKEESRSHGNSYGHSHGHPHHAKHTMDPRKQQGRGQPRYKATDFDMDKLRSTLKQFVRDWSEDVRVFVIQNCPPSVIDAPPGEGRT